MQEMWVQSLGQYGSLEKGMATHSRILAWRIPWTEGAWWTIVHQIAEESDMTYRLNSSNYKFSFWIFKR